jgi:hypothetical protein
MPPRPPLPLSARVSELAGCWLELRCCKGTTFYPLRMLAEAGRGNVELGDVLPRLRCRVCGDEPATVALVETAASSGPGGERQGWRVELR